VALGVVSVYVVVMLTSALAARGVVSDAWAEMHGRAPRALMVGPLPLVPFSRQVIIDAGDHYETGLFSWLNLSVTFFPEHIPKNGSASQITAAQNDNNIRAFLVWARFPFWTIEPGKDGTRVTVSDMRFAGRNGFFASTIVH
jgi:hypothetical protein